MVPLPHSAQQWVEKYRPRQVKDVAQQDEVARVLTNTLETSNCPHMLFYGPPGTGKTTTALAIAHQLFGTPPCIITHFTSHPICAIVSKISMAYVATARVLLCLLSREKYSQHKYKYAAKKFCPPTIPSEYQT